VASRWDGCLTATPGRVRRAPSRVPPRACRRPLALLPPPALVNPPLNPYVIPMPVAALIDRDVLILPDVVCEAYE